MAQGAKEIAEDVLYKVTDWHGAGVYLQRPYE